jgi:hypothetical protein
MISAYPKGSKQSSQKDCHLNADTASTKGMSSGRSALLEGVELITASAVKREGKDSNSKPSYVVWREREKANCLTPGDKKTVAEVVADKLFQKAKFVDRDLDLVYGQRYGTIYKFVANSYNLQANIIDISTWWKEARK